jgi:transposase
MSNDHRLKELERRRRRAARLLAAGTPQSEVARRVSVSRQSVWQWDTRIKEGGPEALRRSKQFGRPRKPSNSPIE